MPDTIGSPTASAAPDSPHAHLYVSGVWDCPGSEAGSVPPASERPLQATAVLTPRIHFFAPLAKSSGFHVHHSVVWELLDCNLRNPQSG